MHEFSGRDSIFRRFITLGLILGCLTGVLLAQTFQYSRGWTNGKKRTFSQPPGFYDADEKQEGLGICRMIKFNSILHEGPQDKDILPYEMHRKFGGHTFVRNFDSRSIPTFDSSAVLLNN